MSNSPWWSAPFLTAPRPRPLPVLPLKNPMAKAVQQVRNALADIASGANAARQEPTAATAIATAANPVLLVPTIAVLAPKPRVQAKAALLMPNAIQIIAATGSVAKTAGSAVHRTASALLASIATTQTREVIACLKDPMA